MLLYGFIVFFYVVNRKTYLLHKSKDRCINNKNQTQTIPTIQTIHTNISNTKINSQQTPQTKNPKTHPHHHREARMPKANSFAQTVLFTVFTKACIAIASIRGRVPRDAPPRGLHARGASPRLERGHGYSDVKCWPVGGGGARRACAPLGDMGWERRPFLQAVSAKRRFVHRFGMCVGFSIWVLEIVGIIIFELRLC